MPATFSRPWPVSSMISEPASSALSIVAVSSNVEATIVELCRS